MTALKVSGLLKKFGDIVALDEPLTNPDAKLGHDTRAEFKSVLRTGLNVIVVFAVIVVLAPTSTKLYGIYFVG
jgi:hypothetical protein